MTFRCDDAGRRAVTACKAHGLVDSASMGVWKPNLEGQHQSFKHEGLSESHLDALLDRLELDPKDQKLRRDVGDAMMGLGLSRHRNWVLEFQIRSAHVLDRVRAEAWFGSIDQELPSGRRASKKLSDYLQTHFETHGYENPGFAGMAWEVSWTSRPV